LTTRAKSGPDGWIKNSSEASLAGFSGNAPLYNVPGNTFFGPEMPLRLDDAHKETKKKWLSSESSLLCAARNVARGYHNIKHACCLGMWKRIR
jgi:hypothetical protein